MPNFTTNLNLEKPLSNENYNIEVFNENADKLDTAIKEVSSKVDNFEAPVKSVNGKTGAVTLAAADIKTVDGKTLEQFKVDASSQLDTKANLVDGKVSMEELPPMDFIPIGEKGKANGVATLDTDGYLALSNIKSSAEVGITQRGTGSLTFTGIDFGKYNRYEFNFYCSSTSTNNMDVIVESLVSTYVSVSSSKYAKLTIYRDGTIETNSVGSFYANYAPAGMVEMLASLSPTITKKTFPQTINKITFNKSSGTDSVTIIAIPRCI